MSLQAKFTNYVVFGTSDIRPCAALRSYHYAQTGIVAASKLACFYHRRHPRVRWPAGWLTGRYRRSRPRATSDRAAAFWTRFDYDLPENQRKLDLVEELLKLAADAGVSLTHLAHAFVLEHPAVTSAIIGPRTMEQLTDVLAGADVRLTNEVLDRIDEIVPPGTNVDAADAGYQPPSLGRKARPPRPRR